MKSIYLVLDEKERDIFEKTYQLPYGYGNTIIFLNLLDAIDFVDEKLPSLVVEKVNEKGRDIVYRGKYS